MAASYQMLFELNAAMGGGFTSAFTQGSQQIENMKNKLDALNSAGSTGDLLGGISSALAATGVIKGLEAIYDGLQECVSAASEFETAMAGVQRTVGGDQDFIAGLGESFKQLSTQMPITASELAEIATTAGQLGIAQADVESFTTVMAQLATTTDLTADDAATMLAQFANITGLTDYERLGSTVAALGDSTATTASKVVQMSHGLAASATQAGMTETDILAISAAVGSLGIEAQAGSTAMSTLISTLYKSVETGDKLEQFASVAGMTAEQFKQAWGEDAVSAMDAFIQGLNDTERNGKSAVVILDELGITNVRQTKAILGLASAGDLLSNTIAQANDAWAQNTALGEKAGIMYETTEAKMTMMQNAANNVKIAIGDALTPMVSGFAEAMTGILEPIAEFIEQNPAIVQGITAFVSVLGVAAAALAAYTAYTKLAAAANLLFGGSIPGIGLILGVAAAIGGLVWGVGELTKAYNDANPSVEQLADRMDQLTEQAKEQQAVIDLVDEYKDLTKEIAEIESKTKDTKTTITIDAEPGQTVSVSEDLVVDKDGNVYKIDAVTGQIVSVAKELVTDKDGNTYVIDASAGQKVSVSGDLVTDKTGNTYVIDAKSGRHVSVRDDLVVDKDGNVYMIDAATGHTVSVKYDLVTEADGTQYVINAITGQKVKVNTDLVYGNSEDELRQVVNAEAGTKVSVSGELVIDKDGNTYVINAKTGQKVSVEADLVTDKDGTVYMINAKEGTKVSVSKQLVTDQDGKLVEIDGEAGDTVSVYSLITDVEGKTVTIDATLNADGVADGIKELSEAEKAEAESAADLASKKERLFEVTQSLRDSSDGLITATDAETDALNRQIEALNNIKNAELEVTKSKIKDTVYKQAEAYVKSTQTVQEWQDRATKAKAEFDTAMEYSGTDGVDKLKTRVSELASEMQELANSTPYGESVLDNLDFKNARAELESIIELVTGVDKSYDSGAWQMMIRDALGLQVTQEGLNEAVQSTSNTWKYYEQNATDAGAAQQTLIDSLINGVSEGTIKTEELEATLNDAFKDYTNGGEIVAGIMEQVTTGVNAAKAAAEGSGEVAQTESSGSIEAISGVITKVEELRQAYENAKASAKEALDGKFGLFDQAGLSDERQSVDEMGQGIQSQTEYWNLYNDNLQAVLDKGLAPEIAKQLADGSQESAEALASLAEASEEEIQSINEAFAELEASKDALASTIADMQTDFSTKLAAMKTELDTAIAELDQSGEAAKNALATMTAYVDGLNAEDENASSAAKSIAANVNAALAAITDVDVDITYHYKTEGSPPSDAGGGVEGHNAIGSDYAAEGLHLVGEEGPELVYMGGGEKILTAHETVNALSGSGSGGNVISVNFSPSYNVSGSQNASELRSVLAEQSANLRDQITEIMEDIVTDKMRVAYA